MPSATGRRIVVAEIRLVVAVGVMMGLAAAGMTSGRPAPIAASIVSYSVESVVARRFGLCGTGARRDCVVDGDTFWLDGEKVRLADIDTPETHPPRCAGEAALGARATTRLAALLNAGAFTLATAADGRDTDRYGRKLRIATRGGESLGDRLVAEGLARRWEGRRRPWCGTGEA